MLIAPMRGEMTAMGAKELKTAAQVDEAVKNTTGTLMLVVNSVCGCAAGKARPGIAMALQHAVKPDVVATVFAGGDVEATERARSYFTGYSPSSPSKTVATTSGLTACCSAIAIHGRAFPAAHPQT